MKRFEFPLERVRRWRAGQAALEELKLEQLGERLAKLGVEKRSAEAARLESEREVLGHSPAEATDLQSLDAYRRHTRSKIRGIEERERETAELIGQQRQRVVQARRAVELLERLKQRAMEEWQAACDREQESLAAELYLARFTRRR
jgi:hypothetical protein